MTPTAREFETTLIVGGDCGITSTEEYWCTQPMEYTLRHFDRTGAVLDALEFDPPYYRPLRSRQPEEFPSPEGLEWLKSWDTVMGIDLIDDFTAIVETVGEGQVRADFLDLRRGEILGSIKLPGSILHYDRESGKLFVRGPVPEEPYSLVHILDVQQFVTRVNE